MALNRKTRAVATRLNLMEMWNESKGLSTSSIWCVRLRGEEVFFFSLKKNVCDDSIAFWTCAKCTLSKSSGWHRIRGTVQQVQSQQARLQARKLILNYSYNLFLTAGRKSHTHDLLELNQMTPFTPLHRVSQWQFWREKINKDAFRVERSRRINGHL